MAAILTNLQTGDVLFIDEIHRMPIAVEEVLYSAMEDNRLDIIIGTGPSAKTVKIDLNPFTLVGATTRLGLLSNPLKDRFGITMQLEFYSPDELAKIVHRYAEKQNIKVKVIYDGRKGTTYNESSVVVKVSCDDKTERKSVSINMRNCTKKV